MLSTIMVLFLAIVILIIFNLCQVINDFFYSDIYFETGFAGAKYAAQLLCDTIAKMQVDIGKRTWLVSISIGFANKEDNIHDIDQLIKVTDQGLYLAKKAGGNCIRSIYLEDKNLVTKKIL
jgi:GGDEF domain-containing protein